MPNATNTTNTTSQTSADEAVHALCRFCSIFDIDTLFIVGEWCQAAHLDSTFNVNRVDVLSAFGKHTVLFGKLFASEIANISPVVDKEKNTVLVDYDGISIRFRGDATVSHIFDHEVKAHLSSQQIDDVPLMREVFSRDFTIDGLVFSLSTRKFYDVTQKSMEDLRGRKISTILPADMLFVHRPAAVLRAIELSVKEDLKIDPSTSSAMRRHGHLLETSLDRKKILEWLVKILRIDSTKALESLKKYNLDMFLGDPKIREFVRVGE